MAEPAPRKASRQRRLAPAVAGTMALTMAYGVAATETGTKPEATTLLETPPADDRHVCAYYDVEHATYTGTVAVLERADDNNGKGTVEGAAYRLLVLTTREDTPQDASEGAVESVLTGEQALALLRNAQAAQREGRATREEYRGHAVRKGIHLRFTHANGHGMPKTMIVFTTAGLAIIESIAGQRITRSDGPYRCARPPPPGNPPLLPTHCAEGRSGNVDLDNSPAPRTEIMLIQNALDKAGMTPGPIDGILGPRTLGALIRWNERMERRWGWVLVYEVICPLIETHGSVNTP